MLENGRFLLSTLDDFPKLKDAQGRPLKEIALAGRSNVGKSSLINHLLGKKMAKVSSTPGKTQQLIFFSVNEEFILTDLPGWGFAKAPKHVMKEWSQAVDEYLCHRESLQLLIVLVDCRRELEQEEKQLLDFAKAKGLLRIVLLTKTDKLSLKQIAPYVEKLQKKLECEVIPYSVHHRKMQAFLEKKILQVIRS